MYVQMSQKYEFMIWTILFKIEKSYKLQLHLSLPLNLIPILQYGIKCNMENQANPHNNSQTDRQTDAKEANT